MAEDRLASIAAGFQPTLDSDTANAVALHQLSSQVNGQAMVMAFSDIFLILAIIFAAMVFLVPLVHRPKPTPGAAAAGH